MADFRFALELMLEDIGLTYQIRDGAILVTAPRGKKGEKKNAPD